MGGEGGALHTEDLGQIGANPCNEYLLRPVEELAEGSDVPAGGFTGRMAKASPVAQLKEALSKRLAVPHDGVCLAVDGRELDDAQTIGENGVLEPGPAARRAGAKIPVAFMLAHGVELGGVIERRRAEMDAKREALERQELLKKEEAARAKRDAEARREAAAQAEAQAKAEAEAREAAAAREAHPLAVRCSPLGTSGGQEVRTHKGATVAELAQAVSDQMGMRGQEGHLTLTFNGNVLNGRMPLREAGVEEGAEILYYWVGHD